MNLYIEGLDKLKTHFSADDTITYEKTGYQTYNDETSSKYIEWSPDKGEAMENHLEGDTLHFVDDDISNFKLSQNISKALIKR